MLFYVNLVLTAFYHSVRVLVVSCYAILMLLVLQHIYNSNLNNMSRGLNLLMTQSAKLLIILAGVVVLAACNRDEVDPELDPNDEVVVIEDSELRDIVMETLNLRNPDDITVGKMSELTEINLSNSIVASLSGLEKAVNLEVILGRSLDVSDFSPLAELEKIKEIDFRDANMDGDKSLSFLSNASALEKIDFQNTSVDNISVLAGKNTLTHINLRETDVTSIAALQGMNQLLFLNLNRAGGGNGITDPEVTISMDKLYYLSLRNTQLGDDMFAQIFANKTQMVESNVRNTGITDISPLVAIFEAGAFTQALSNQYGNKISLDLQNNPITNLCVIEPWVENFPEGELEWSAVAGDFSNCDEDPGNGGETGGESFIEDEALLDIILSTMNLNSAAELTEEKILELTELNISGTEVVTLAGLEKATNLERLNAQGAASLEDISALAGFENLVFLNLRETAVSDISALEGMTQMQYLNLNRAGSGSGITNPEIIAPMVNLYYLSLRNTSLTAAQFEMFENFDQLVEVNLRNTNITSIAPLAEAFKKGAFTVELSEQYGNKLSLDLQNNTIEDLCLISEWVGVFPDGELETAGNFDFSTCED